MGLSIDREKVIKELESLRDICNAKSNMAIGNGKVALAGYANAADDAITLLKEQEPVEPEVEVLNGIYRLYRCQRCHKCFFYEKQKYCDQCGQAVKWE